MRYVAIISFALGIAMSALPTAAHARTGITLRFDFAGARAVLAVLGTKNPTDAQINRTVAVQGVHAMIKNTIKYLPSNNLAGFASAPRIASRNFVTDCVISDVTGALLSAAL